MLSRVGTFISSSAATGEGRSLAAQLLGTEPNGFAVHFLDMSMVVRDTTTPANNYSGLSSAKLLGTSLNRVATGLSLGASDNVYLPTSVFPYSTTAFSIIAKASSTALTNNAPAALNLNGSYSLGAGALMRFQGASAVAVGGSLTSTTKTISPSLSAGEMIKVGACFRTSDNSMSVTNRGLAVATITTGDWNGTSNRFQLGALDSAGTQALVGVLEWIVYLPRYDTAEIVSRTA